MTDKTTKFAAVSLDLIGKDPDQIDWEIMTAVRGLAQELELFDPSMYAVITGQLVHAQACEMSYGDFMVMDMSESKKVRGFASDHQNGNDNGAMVLNHYHVVVLKRENYIITLSKGRNVPDEFPASRSASRLTIPVSSANTQKRKRQNPSVALSLFYLIFGQMPKFRRNNLK